MLNASATFAESEYSCLKSVSLFQTQNQTTQKFVAHVLLFHQTLNVRLSLKQSFKTKKMCEASVPLVAAAFFKVILICFQSFSLPSFHCAASFLPE